LAVLRPRVGGLRRGEISGSAFLQPARSVCVSLSAFFIYACLCAGGQFLFVVGAIEIFMMILMMMMMMMVISFNRDRAK